MADIGDIFTYNGQKYGCIGHELGQRFVQTTEGNAKAKASALSVWQTNCPECGAAFTVTLTGNWPFGRESLTKEGRLRTPSRRCGRCHSPGKPVGEITAKSQEYALWRPQAFRVIYLTLETIYAQKRRPIGPAEVAHALAENETLPAYLKDAMSLKQFPYAGKKLGRLMCLMANREWLAQDGSQFTPRILKPGEDFGMSERTVHYVEEHSIVPDEPRPVLDLSAYDLPKIPHFEPPPKPSQKKAAVEKQTSKPEQIKPAAHAPRSTEQKPVSPAKSAEKLTMTGVDPDGRKWAIVNGMKVQTDAPNLKPPKGS